MAWRAPGAGELRDRIAVESRSRVSDGMGGAEDAWVPVLSAIPARIVAVKGGEAVQSMRLSGTAPYDVTIRLTNDTRTITSGHRIVNERTGEPLNVKWVGSLEEGRQAWLSLACVAGEVAE